MLNNKTEPSKRKLGLRGKQSCPLLQLSLALLDITFIFTIMVLLQIFKIEDIFLSNYLLSIYTIVNLFNLIHFLLELYLDNVLHFLVVAQYLLKALTFAPLPYCILLITASVRRSIYLEILACFFSHARLFQLKKYQKYLPYLTKHSELLKIAMNFILVIVFFVNIIQSILIYQ